MDIPLLWLVYRFSKSAHFTTLPNKFSACQPAELFTTMDCKLRGPKSIILDRDPIFMSRFWQTLFQVNGPKLRIVLHTISKPTGKQRSSIGAFNNTYMPLCIVNRNIGENTFTRQNGITTLLFTVLQA